MQIRKQQQDSTETALIKVFRLEDIEDGYIFDDYQRYDFYQLLWFKKVSGNPVYFLDFKEYSLKDNQIVLIFPGQIDQLDIEGKEGYLFTIDVNVFFDIGQRLNSDYLNGYFSNVFLTPDYEIQENLEALIKLIFTEYDSQNRLPLIRTYIEAFLFQISGLFECGGMNDKTDIHQVARLMKLIDQYFILQRGTEFYSGEMGISNKKINQISLKGTGKTVKQHLQERLVLEIKREIHLGKKSLKEIAFNLGFNEPAYFTRFFKTHTGTTPSEFQQSVQ